jgi:hypothetical protein
VKNGIVCSLVSKEHDYLQNLYLYKQLSYAIKTLREVNKNIPVIIYISAFHKGNNHHDYFPYDNIHFVEFENKISDGWDEEFIKLTFAEVMEHRWKNAFRGLEEFEFDNIIYMDTDIRFFKDPELLFEKYGNTDYVWSREDVCLEEMDIMGITPAMNDGVVILNKSVLKHKDLMQNHMKKYINDNLIYYKDKMTKEQHFHLYWIITQFAAFNYLNVNGIHKYVDKKHVKLHIEPLHDDLSESIMHHYFTGNHIHFLPSEYQWIIDQNTHERIQ